MDREVISDVLGRALHIGNMSAVKLHILLNALAFMVTYFTGFVMDNIDQFVAITAVVFLDFIFGISVALKNSKFETRKALKVVWYFAGYCSLLAVLLLVEKAFVGAFWLSETIIIPILIFQLISVLKNMGTLGIIPSKTLNSILKKVDKYKDEDN